MTDTPTEREAESTRVQITWARLRRRKVVQWGLVYVAGAWGFLQGLGYFSDAFEWPAQLRQVALLALLIGLPVVVVLAWYHGDRGEQRISGVELSIIGLLLALGGGIFWRYERAAEPPSAARGAASPPVTPAPLPLDLAPATYSLRSIAVLPFVNMSSDPDNEYFSDGLSEELITLLARLPGWKVIARTSSFAYKGKDTKISDIARELQVATVLEGSVRKSGDKVRITAQLVRASNSMHLWSQTYDRTLDDIFAVQDDIAAQVVKAIETALLIADHSTRVATAVEMPLRSRVRDSPVRPAPRRPRNAEAYNLLLQGRFFAERRTQKDSESAIRYLQQSLERDPTNALAWVDLANVYMAQADDGETPLVEGYGRAREAVEQALALDPNLASAHSAMGWIQSGDFDWVSAEKSMRKAQLLEPGNAGVLLRAGWIDAQLGRSKEALFLIERSIKLDPLQVYGHEYRAYLLLGLGRYAESEAAYRKVDELSPNREGNHTAIGTALLLAGKADEALREIERETNEPWRLSGLGLVNYTLGRPSDSDAALKELKRKYAAEAPVRIGEVYAWRGEDDLAFEWLDRAYLERNAYAYDIKMNPFFQRLQSDHRFTAFLHKMKLQEWPAQAIGATGK